MTKLVTMSKYEALIDTKIEWLDEIPSSWELVRLKYVVEILKRIAGKEGFDVLSITQRGIKIKDIDNGKGQLAMDYSKYQLVFKGDFAMNHMDLLTGYVDRSIFNGVVSPDYRVFTNINAGVFEPYLLLLFQLGYIQRIFYKYGQGVSLLGRWRFPADSFNNFYIPVPSLSEQYKIVEYVNKKTAQIDQAIAIKEMQIALLKERKKIIIQQAVTQGLNPDAPMKDSGVDWIGQIPKHWAFEPIKYSLKGVIDCEHKTAPFVDETEFFVVRTTNVKDGKLQIKGAKYTHEKGFKEWTRRGVPKAGDVLLTREAPAGEACLVPDNINLCLGQRMVWLKVDRERLLPEFAISLIYSSIGRTYIDFLSSGSTVLHFNMADINNIPVVLPPMDEQRELVKFIGEESGKVDDTIEIQKQQIEKLKEYKTTLINSAVTGKIKVPEAI